MHLRTVYMPTVNAFCDPSGFSRGETYVYGGVTSCTDAAEMGAQDGTRLYKIQHTIMMTMYALGHRRRDGGESVPRTQFVV